MNIRVVMSPVAAEVTRRSAWVRSSPPPHVGGYERASVLIIVLWVAFGLVSLALYFAHSMSFELRAADNRVAGVEAQQAIEGAARYVSNILATAETPGASPDTQVYEQEAVPVGDAKFWLIGRDTNDWQTGPAQPVFGLVDEASKLNLNTATLEMLEMLPGMTPDLAASIVAWRSTGTAPQGGAADTTYQQLNPAYRCKHAPFETVDELRLVHGMTLDILYGEDANLNGILDPNENDGDLSPPSDNRDGKLDPGILEYLTVYSRELNNNRTNVTDRAQLSNLLQGKFGAARANQVLLQFSVPGGGQSNTNRSARGANAPLQIGSVLEFYVRSGLTEDEFAQIANDITTTNSAYVEGLVNVNTAGEAVLACIPGIGADNAPTMVAYRQSNPGKLASIAWVVDVLGRENALRAAPRVTTHSYQFTADIAAVGHHSRGYQRVKFVFDTSEGSPKVIYRQDLTRLGWALGKETRNNLLLAKESS